MREQYQVVARGSIGPMNGLKFLIDTGSMPSVVDRRVAKMLAMNVEGSETVSFGQKSRSGTTVLPNIQLGSLRVAALRASVGDLSFLRGVDAIMGLDVLSRTSFSIDYREQQLALGPVRAGEVNVSLGFTFPFATVNVDLGGQAFRLIADTGSRRLVLFEHRLGPRLPDLAARGYVQLYDAGGKYRLKRVALPRLTVGGSAMEGVEGFVSGASMDGYPAGIDGVLGIRALASRRVDFDFERNRLGLS